MQDVNSPYLYYNFSADFQFLLTWKDSFSLLHIVWQSHSIWGMPEVILWTSAMLTTTTPPLPPNCPPRWSSDSELDSDPANILAGKLSGHSVLWACWLSDLLWLDISSASSASIIGASIGWTLTCFCLIVTTRLLIWFHLLMIFFFMKRLMVG